MILGHVALVHVALTAWLAQAPASMRTLDTGPMSNIDEPRQVVARTTGEWSALWKAHNPGRPAPAVDLSREMVIGLFMGSRPTAGYSVRITGIERRDDALVIKYDESAPPRGALTAQVLTSPYHIVAIPKADGEVKFERVKTGR
jgi:hypothetical protein